MHSVRTAERWPSQTSNGMLLHKHYRCSRNVDTCLLAKLSLLMGGRDSFRSGTTLTQDCRQCSLLLLSKHNRAIGVSLLYKCGLCLHVSALCRWGKGRAASQTAGPFDLQTLQTLSREADGTAVARVLQFCQQLVYTRLRQAAGKVEGELPALVNLAHTSTDRERPQAVERETQLAQAARQAADGACASWNALPDLPVFDTSNAAVRDRSDAEATRVVRAQLRCPCQRPGCLYVQAPGPINLFGRKPPIATA